MNRMVVLIATFLVASAATAQDSTGNSTHASCDFNRDGQVDEYEKRECEAAYEKCDTNGDGHISDQEESDCRAAYENDTKSHEDHNGTSASGDACASAGVSVGSSSESDHEECESSEGSFEYSYQYEDGDPAEHCDFDGDGNVTASEYEDERCKDAIEDHYDDERKEREAAIADAEARGVLGGSFQIRDRVQQEIETAEGVKVRIQHDSPNVIRSSTNGDVKVTFDAELDEGRTFIIDIDPALFGGSEILVRYFVEHPETGVELEGTIQQASGLRDILDPSDDGDEAEYWIVEDEAGLHVMVSIPHWSVHSVALEADSSGAVGSPGPATPLMLAGLALVAVMVRRRNQ